MGIQFENWLQNDEANSYKSDCTQVFQCYKQKYGCIKLLLNKCKYVEIM